MPNIIIFGEASSGKSSVVNLIVGEEVARVAESAEGCTIRSDAHRATISGTTFNIYDTAGLNDAEEGRVPHWEAVRQIYTLIRQLDGVSLLIYCTRRRVRGNAMANWILFNKVICGERVPIIAVVTGLETYDDPDEWWRDKGNRAMFRKNKMNPVGVGCVVAFAGKRGEYGRLYIDSQTKLRDLIMKHYLNPPWRYDWLADYYMHFSSRLCYATQTRVEYSPQMQGRIDEFINATRINKEDSKKLEVTLFER